MALSLQILCFLIIGLRVFTSTAPRNSEANIKEFLPEFSQNIMNPAKRAKLQIEEDGDEDQTLSPDQFNFIGNNVAKVVASSLTGNLGGIFSGGLNLFNTNNRLNGLFGRPIAQAPNGTVTTRSTASATATTSDSVSAEEEDDDEDSDSVARDRILSNSKIKTSL